jgi:hypothetical protein
MASKIALFFIFKNWEMWTSTYSDKFIPEVVFNASRLDMVVKSFFLNHTQATQILWFLGEFNSSTAFYYYINMNDKKSNLIFLGWVNNFFLTTPEQLKSLT